MGQSAGTAPCHVFGLLDEDREVACQGIVPAVVGDLAATLGLEADVLPTLVVSIAEPDFAEPELGMATRKRIVGSSEAFHVDFFEQPIDLGELRSLGEQAVDRLSVAHPVEETDLPVEGLRLDLSRRHAFHGEDGFWQPLDGVSDTRCHHHVLMVLVTQVVEDFLGCGVVIHDALL